MGKFIDLTGKKFGKLTVIKMADDHISSKGKKEKQWLCHCDCGNDAIIRGSYLRSGQKESCGCEKRFTSEESKAWYDLCKYVEKNVLGYSDDVCLSKNMCLRLQGLSSSKFMANNNIKSNSNYSYEIILNTFKFCNPDIQKKIRGASFVDEDHKFNYILRIVDGKLSTVYFRMKNMKKAKETAEKDDVSEAYNYVNRFKTKERKKNDRLKDLW